jgi:hypothetical protein
VVQLDAFTGIAVTSLHWQGPAIVAQWGVLTHLSLVVNSFGPERLEDVLVAAINVRYLTSRKEATVSSFKE